VPCLGSRIHEAAYSDSAWRTRRYVQFFSEKVRSHIAVYDVNVEETKLQSLQVTADVCQLRCYALLSFYNCEVCQQYICMVFTLRPKIGDINQILHNAILQGVPFAVIEAVLKVAVERMA
jgi:hypothetical protein